MAARAERVVVGSARPARGVRAPGRIRETLAWLGAAWLRGWTMYVAAIRPRRAGEE
ncbi:MAG TPA: hypothetical protein VK939_17870 [Longimicrobiales bacterium]|nr:hypothetical protein [Longimicrobiales bacterium]